MLRLQKEREIDEVRRQHEKEVYLLKKKLFEASNNGSGGSPDSSSGQILNNGSPNPSSVPDNAHVRILIPRFHLPSGDHVEFEVVITTKDATWTVFRRFRRFRDLHVKQSSLYGPTVTGLNFPSRRLFGNTSETVSHQRQLQLQTYLNGLVQRCSLIQASPLFQKPYQAALLEFSTFFEPDANS